MAFKECQSDWIWRNPWKYLQNQDRLKLLRYWPRKIQRKVFGLRDAGVKHQGIRGKPKEQSSWNRWSDRSSMKTIMQQNA